MQISMNKFTLCTLALLLAGCGDGWEAKRTDELVPYGNQRTAGTGVMYVRAQMLPPKQMTAADEIFTDSLTKVQPHAGDPAGAYEPAAANEPAQAVLQPVSLREEPATMEKSVTPEKAASYMNDPAPSQPPLSSAVEPEVAPAAEKNPVTWDKGAALGEDQVIQEEANKRALASLKRDLAESASQETVFISEKEIIAPKRDVLSPAEQGQITLDEIYNGVYDDMRTL